MIRSVYLTILYRYHNVSHYIHILECRHTGLRATFKSVNDDKLCHECKLLTLEIAILMFFCSSGDNERLDATTAKKQLRDLDLSVLSIVLNMSH